MGDAFVNSVMCGRRAGEELWEGWMREICAGVSDNALWLARREWGSRGLDYVIYLPCSALYRQ